MPSGPTSASASVVQAIRDGIYSGRFLPGQRLRERELSEDCQVGRSSVREAFRTLVSDGVIVAAPRRSPVVRQFSEKELIAQFELREALEGLAASLAARRSGDRAAMDTLTKLVADMGEAVRGGRTDAFLQMNRDYHSQIILLSGNPFIAEHINRTQILPLRLQSSRLATAESIAASHADHRAITDAIRSGDGIEAESVMRRHIQRTRQRLLAAPDRLFSIDRTQPIG